MVIVKAGASEAGIASAGQVMVDKRKQSLRHVVSFWFMAFPPVFVRLAPEARTGGKNLKRHVPFFKRSPLFG
jgi:hypothetical protein